MFLESREDMERSFGVLTPDRYSELDQYWSPGAGELFGASIRQAFDRTLGARAWEEVHISGAAASASDEGALEYYATEEEYNNSPDYRPGIAYNQGLEEDSIPEEYAKILPESPGMLKVRARILAENYDKRRQLGRVIQGADENGPWWSGPVGFGGGIIGSLPDPINIVPFGGAAAQGVKLAGMTGRKLLAQSARRGAVEGAVSNLISSSVAARDLNTKGEDMGALDVLTDTAFGAAAGPLFHGVGSFIGRRRARSRLRSDLDLAYTSLDEGSPLRAQFKETLDRMKRGDAEAYASGGAVVDRLDRAGFIGSMRSATTPDERLQVARAMELAVSSVVEDLPVDISAVSPNLRTSQIRALVDNLENANFTEMQFGTLLTETIDALNSIRLEEGATLIRDGRLVLPANVVKKLYEKRMVQGGMSADDLANLLVRVFYGEADFAAGTRQPHIQAIVALRNELADIGFIGVNPRTGDTVIKSVYSVKKGDISRTLGEGKTAPEGRPTPSTLTGEEPGARQPGRFTDRRSGSDAENITPDSTQVNADLVVMDIHGFLGKEGTTIGQVEQSLADLKAFDPEGFQGLREGFYKGESGAVPGTKAYNELQGAFERVDGSPAIRVIDVDAELGRIDWRTETGPDYPPLPDRAGDETAQGVTPERLEIEALREQGKLAEDDARTLLRHEEERASVDRWEDDSLSIIDCAMRIGQ